MNEGMYNITRIATKRWLNFSSRSCGPAVARRRHETIKEAIEAAHRDSFICRPGLRP
jgi:hypothetical protein